MKRKSNPYYRIEKHNCHVCDKLLFSKKYLIRDKKKPFFLEWLSHHKELSMNPYKVRYITIERKDDNEVKYFCVECGIRYIADPENKHKLSNARSHTTNCFETELPIKKGG